MIRFDLYLEEEILKELRAQAKKEGVSVAELIRRAVVARMELPAQRNQKPPSVK